MEWRGGAQRRSCVALSPPQPLAAAAKCHQPRKNEEPIDKQAAQRLSGARRMKKRRRRRGGRVCRRAAWELQRGVYYYLCGLHTDLSIRVRAHRRWSRMNVLFRLKRPAPRDQPSLCHSAPLLTNQATRCQANGDAESLWFTENRHLHPRVWRRKSPSAFTAVDTLYLKWSFTKRRDDVVEIIMIGETSSWWIINSN